MGDIATKGNRLTQDQHGGRIKRIPAKGPPTHPDDLRPEQTPKGRGREIKVSNKQPGLLRHKFQSGGRTRLLEELGRVEAEPSNRNRRAEISRVHGELNRGYAKGGRAGYAIGSIVKGGRHIGKLLKKVGKEIKDQPLPPQLKGKAEELKKAFPHHDSKGKLKKAEGGRAGFVVGGIAAAQVKYAAKAYKKYKKKKKLAEDTKKGKFPETESLTHQKGPYVGDVGSEKSGTKRIKWEKPERPGPKRPEWTRPLGVGGRERVGQAKGGKTDKKWIQKAVNPKHKGYCTPMTKKTCTPARKALARTFKKKAKTGWG